MADRVRLDQLVELRGLARSRSRSADAIRRGTVRVDGAVVSKPGQMVAADSKITIDDAAGAYVSRAALKLAAGLDAAELDVAGLTCLDIGASTGGFTQVLLERGARQVFAIDVGTDQLAPEIRSDPRVIEHSQTDARQLDASLIAAPVDLLVCDVSFVSVTKVLEAPLALVRAGGHAVVLFKPQFEVGRDHVGKGGVVSDPMAIEQALALVKNWLKGQRLELLATLPSPIAGGDGNRETVLVLKKVV